MLTTLSDTDVRAKVERCRGRLLAASPWFGALGMNLRLRQTTTCLLMATDGTHLFYNALGCATATEPELIFVWAHEIYHCGLLHMYRKPSWLDWHEWNICTDLAINAQLIEMRVGQAPKNIFYDARYANLSAEQIAHARRKARQQAEQERQQAEQQAEPEPEQDADDTNSADQDADADDGDNEQGSDSDDADDDTQDGESGQDVGGTASNEDEQAGDGETDDGTGPSDDDGTGSETGEPGREDAGAADNASDSTGDGGEPGQDAGEQSGSATAYDPTNPDGTLEPGDDCLPPPTGADGEQAEPEPLDETQWQTAVDQATAITRKAGEMPGLVERAIEGTRKSRTDWREVLRAFVEQISPADYTWQRPNRRYLSGGLYLPGTHRENLPPMLVVVDTSGSCSQHELDIFAGALTSILQECKPREVTVIYCDTRVNGEPERFTPDDGEVVLTTRGGGGTYFQPAFDWLTDAQADGTLVEPPCCILYLTDGYAADLARLTEPEIPTLFAIVPGGTLEMPFGEVVAMDVD